ncbi:hypothetical protein ACFOSE_05905 [Streptococcus dentapri]|uniref:Fungal lipase-like domain-containing protein n=1 Tax=Streptococcus dentapri TaxID=573564 RepID=A0ABV8D2M0_9STRE
MDPDDFNYEDWINNNMAFALTDAIVPQASEATAGMKAKIAELNAQAAPDAQMSITGHSLGTIVSIQGAAGLSHDELQKVDQIVLFDGPDATESLKKAGYSEAKIQELGSKTTYYVNPFDPLSMLNRDKPWEDQLGHVNVIVSREYTSLTDKHSSHDFGAYQIDSQGNFLVASADYHPELLTAGHDLAVLEKESIDKLKKYIPEDLIQSIVALSPEDFNELAKLAQKVAKNPSLSGGSEVIKMAEKLGISVSDLVSALTHAGDLQDVFQNFQEKYQAIIDKAKKEGLKWIRNNIGSFHDRIRSASGSERILLRTELLYMATQLAEEDISNKVEAAKKHISDCKEQIELLSTVGINCASQLGSHLSPDEIKALTSELQLSKVWNEGIESSDQSALTQYQNQLSTFGSDLIYAAQNLTAVDAQQAGEIFANLS